MITGINEPKSLTKHISCECKCKFDKRKCNLNQWWNNDKCRCVCKKHHINKKDYILNPATCSSENGKYLASIMDDSAITYHEIIEETVSANFNEKKATWIFINCHSIIYSCSYLLLPDKILRKNKNIYYHFTIQIMNLNQFYIDNINKKWAVNSKIKA